MSKLTKSELENNLRIIIDSLGDDNYIVATKNNVAFQCMMCREDGDTHTDHKLYVSLETGKFICFRCSRKGTISLDDGLGSNSDVYKMLGNMLESMTSDNSSSSEEEEPELFLIPKHKPLPGSVAHDYLLSRGMTQYDIDRYDIRVAGSEMPMFRGRFIVPNKIVGKIFTDMYVARTYMDDKVRYKNPTNANKNKLVFNLHRIPDNPEYIIINEGCLNSIIAGDLSVATYGKHVSDTQLQMILDKKPSRIYVSLDTDALVQAKKLCQRIKERSPEIRVFLVNLPEVNGKGLDAVDLGRETYYKYLDESIEYLDRSTYAIFDYLKSISC